MSSIHARQVLEFHPRLASILPETDALLRAANLTVHSCVSRVMLHGSRGLVNRYRADSDIDLSLLTAMPAVSGSANTDLLQSIYETTYKRWSSNIELDLAVVFETRNCHLKCFDQSLWDAQLCSIGGVDCFGLYKIGKGFNGLVRNAGILVERMYPCLQIWERM